MIIKIKHIKFSPVFGIGYWYDDYSKVVGLNSYTHNILLPFIRIQFGQLTSDQHK
jgi:hypothetical protein